MPTVKFTSNLRRFYPHLVPLISSKNNLVLILQEVEAMYPGMLNYIVDEQGLLRKHVNIFVNNHLIKDREKLSDPVSKDDEVYIMQALSGG